MIKNGYLAQNAKLKFKYQLNTALIFILHTMHKLAQRKLLYYNKLFARARCACTNSFLYKMAFFILCYLRKKQRNIIYNIGNVHAHLAQQK